MIKNVNDLLSQISTGTGTLHEVRRLYSAQLAPDFTLFDYLRNDEMGVSRIIADLLDHQGAHGQGSVFLQAFAKILGTDWVACTDGLQINKEKQANGKRRIDIYMESSEGVVGIENKPWAQDQEQQLIDYANYIKGNAGNKKWLLIYLSNDEPSVKSISKEEWEAMQDVGHFVCLDFYTLADWLVDCAARSKSSVVRLFIDEFAKFVRTKINGELDMSEERMVINEIRKSENNIAAAFHVYNSMDALKHELLHKFQNDLINMLEKTEFCVDWDNEKTNKWSGTFYGFNIKLKDQDKYFRFEFERSGLSQAAWGIRRDSDSVMRTDEVWEKIHEVMNCTFGPGVTTKQWPWYRVVPDLEFDNEYANWKTSSKPWIEMENGGLSEKFVELAKRVHDVFLKEEKLHLLRR